MANALKEAVMEKITVADQYENETTEHKGFNYWLIIPAAMLTVATATGGFFLVRRLRGSSEK